VRGKKVRSELVRGEWTAHKRWLTADGSQQEVKK